MINKDMYLDVRYILVKSFIIWMNYNSYICIVLWGMFGVKNI